jgi:hypothetical protein
MLERLFRPNDAVAVRLEGGLGNQMFQYAAGWTVASRLGCRLVLDTSGLRARGLRTIRPFGLHRWCIEAEVDTLSPRALRACAVVQQPAFTYAPGLLDSVAVGSRLQGYWQSERFFAHERSSLLRHFTLRQAPDADVQAVAQGIVDSAESASVHIRRGDYVSDAQTASFHGSCTLDYYRDCMAELRRDHPGLRLFVFSDDPAWVRAHFPVDPAVVLVQPQPESPEVDLWLMSLCRHHVLANSSFSWWGAWLAQRPGRTLAPARWFTAAAGLDERDLVPASWERR